MEQTHVLFVVVSIRMRKMFAEVRKMFSMRDMLSRIFVRGRRKSFSIVAFLAPPQRNSGLATYDQSLIGK